MPRIFNITPMETTVKQHHCYLFFFFFLSIRSGVYKYPDRSQPNHSRLNRSSGKKDLFRKHVSTYSFFSRGGPPCRSGRIDPVQPGHADAHQLFYIEWTGRSSRNCMGPSERRLSRQCSAGGRGSHRLSVHTTRLSRKQIHFSPRPCSPVAIKETHAQRMRPKDY
ncbi:hypothetical protein CEXT_579571 [Caerostris extrusa]|uniref:Uncharacterized protein n=1 Tax=Caerostris extrusa TaxID=172846 RepID=A0AAV4V0U6_CAEEX|nr:hypothetical protein CEXT_579571 [Caerostris extrusa]